MTGVTVTSVLESIEKYKFNPAMMQRASLAVLRKILDAEIDIVDATNPFVRALETTACNTAGFMQFAEALTRRQYPRASLTPEDLYLHMSDKDYIGRFALPSGANFTFLIAKQELENSLVLDPSTGISKITIPRNTTTTVADRVFSLQYPIDIRKLIHGGLQIVWDVTKKSPLLDLETNLIDWEEVINTDGTVYVKFSVPAYQFNIITRFNDVNAASGFTTTIKLSDQYYYARVFYQETDSSWREIQTTHTKQIFDPLSPTAVLQVLDDKVVVTIPVIYTTTGLVKNKLRIDVYETAGKIDMLLGNYQLDDFVTDWKIIDVNESSQYTSAISNIRQLAVFSTEATAGGRQALSMDDLRLRVIQNSVGPQDIPITNVQLQAEVEDAGYQIVKNVDTITNRIFLATKPMPTPVDSSLITAAASGISTVLVSFEEGVSAYGVTPHYVEGKIQAMTITPSALYRVVNGVTKLVTVQAYQALVALPDSQKAQVVNDGSYSYSPFHYVLDAAEDNFEVRAYHMDSPTILSKSFVAENATSGLQVSIAPTYSIVKTDSGYRLTVSTTSNEAYRALDDSLVFCQLSFRAQTEILSSFLTGVQQPRENPTDERVYVFDMPSSFNLSQDDTLDQPAFQVASAPIVTRSDLLQEVNVLFSSSASPGVGLEFTAIDNALGRFQLPSNAFGVTWEKLKVRFGYSLKTLWAQARTVVGSVPYKVYPANVPRVYEEDVFEINPTTGASFDVVNDQLVYRYLHRKGDAVLTPEGDPVFKHLAGEPVTDEMGIPLPAEGYESELLRHVDIATIEGVYRFANDSVAHNYKQLVSSSLVTWLTKDLVSLSSKLLDKTKIYFYPKATQGDIRVMTKNGVETSMAAGQVFDVVLHVPGITYANPDLIDKITKNTIRVIDNVIKGSTVSVSAIEYALRNSYGTDVIDVRLTGLGGQANYDTVSLLDSANRLAIRKRLTAQPDGTLIVEDAVNFTYIDHSLKQ